MSMTNFEKIKQMTVEQMAEFISFIDIDEVSLYTSIGGDKVFGDEVMLKYTKDIYDWLLKDYE